MPLTLSLNTNPLVNRFADPDDLIDTVARDLKMRDLQLTHEFINPSWPAPVIRRLTRQMGAALAAHRRAGDLGHDRALWAAQPFRPPGPRCAALLCRLVQDLRRHHRRSRRHLGRHAVRDPHLPRLRRSGAARGADRDRHRLLGGGRRAREGGRACLRLLGADERRPRVRRDDRGLPGAAGPADRGGHGGADVDDGRHRPWRRDQRRTRPTTIPTPGRGRCRRCRRSSTSSSR